MKDLKPDNLSKEKRIEKISREKLENILGKIGDLKGTSPYKFYRNLLENYNFYYPESTNHAS